MRPRISLLLLFIIFSVLSCQRSRHASHAFYYWKSSFYEQDYGAMYRHKPDLIYLHYFDVVWDERRQMPIPVSGATTSYNWSWRKLPGVKPVIYIENRVFEKLSSDSCAVFARKVGGKIRRQTRELSITGNISEIQFDCDWTPLTKDKYFAFIRAFRANENYPKLSATIRLYPYKYARKMGVPPVDRGMLMCYNISSINNREVDNSIITKEELKKYITGKIVYPLPLDLAFPVFGWYAWFRNNDFQQIVYGDTRLSEDTSVFQPAPANSFVSKIDTVIDNHYIREGDVLRREYVEPAALREIISYVTNKIPRHGAIAFYHWDTDNIKEYEQLIQETFDHY